MTQNDMHLSISVFTLKFSQRRPIFFQLFIYLFFIFLWRGADSGKIGVREVDPFVNCIMVIFTNFLDFVIFSFFFSQFFLGGFNHMPIDSAAIIYHELAQIAIEQPQYKQFHRSISMCSACLVTVNAIVTMFRDDYQRVMLHNVDGQEKPHMCIWPLNMNTE